MRFPQLVCWLVDDAVAGDVAYEWRDRGVEIANVHPRLNAVSVYVEGDPEALYVVEGDGRVTHTDVEHAAQLEGELDWRFVGDGAGNISQTIRQLDRITQRALPLDGWYFWNATGAGVRVYFVDTPIRGTHVDFGDRWRHGFGETGSGQHGTNVAGLAVGARTGAAFEADIIEVGMFTTGASQANTFTTCVDWILSDMDSAPAGTRAVVNNSWSSTSSVQATQAQRLVDANIVNVAAAGNQGDDASTRFPAGHENTITAGSTTTTDGKRSDSNYGPLVNVFAPGTNLVTTVHGNNNDLRTWDGQTSGASAVTSGVAACILELFPTATPAQVMAMVEGWATAMQVDPNSGTNDSPDRLLFSLESDPTFWGDRIEVVGITVNEYVDGTVETGEWYRYRVKAVDNG